MSKINAKGQLSGAVGPVYFRVLNGKGIVQSKPGKGVVKQGLATKLNAAEFGLASSTAKKIRKVLEPILQNHTDALHYQRFTSKVYEAMITGNEAPRGSRTLANGSPQILEGFEWNAHVNFGKSCMLSPVITCNASSQIALVIPETAITEALVMPKGLSFCDLCYFVVALETQQWTALSFDYFKIPITRTTATISQQHHDTEAIPPGSLVLVVAALQFYSHHSAMGDIPLESKTGFPAAITAVFQT